MKKTLTLTAIAGALLLGGCASSESKQCPLNNKDGFCSSVDEVYNASLNHTDEKENVLSYMAGGMEHDNSLRGRRARLLGAESKGSQHAAPQQPGHAPAPHHHQSLGVGYGAPGGAMVPGREALQGPVFIPAKPYRYWVAPWTDANGIAHSGEMQYFVVPGRFTYGTLDTPGAASGIIGPVSPEELGFIPVQPDADNTTVSPDKQLIQSR